MILVNKNNGLTVRSDNKSFIARTVGYSRRQVHRWVHTIKIKETYSGWTVYVDESLYKKIGEV